MWQALLRLRVAILGLAALAADHFPPGERRSKSLTRGWGPVAQRRRERKVSQHVWDRDPSSYYMSGALLALSLQVEVKLAF